MKLKSSSLADGASAPSALLEPGPPPLVDPDPRSEDQDTGDVSSGVNEDDLDHDEMDTDRVTSLD